MTAITSVIILIVALPVIMRRSGNGVSPHPSGRRSLIVLALQAVAAPSRTAQ